MEKRIPLNNYLVYFVIGTIPILFGAVRHRVWSFYSMIIYLAYLIKIWQDSEHGFHLLGKMGQVFIGLFISWSFFQIIPLPESFLTFLSPWKNIQSTRALALIDKTASWQTITYSWRISLSEIAFIIGMVLFYLLCRDAFKKRRKIKTIANLIIILGVGEALYGIVQSLVPAVGVLWMDPSYAYIGMARGTYVNRNNFAGLMEMILPVTIGYTIAIGYWPLKGKLKKILAYDQLNQIIFFALIIIIMLLSLVFSMSRGGIVGLMVAFTAFYFISRTTLKRNMRMIYITAGIVSLLFCIYGAIMGFNPILDRFLKIGSETSRLDIWKDSWAMVKNHPLGVGLGNYEYVYPIYQVNFTPHLNVLDAHNDYLQVLTELGWPGFIILVGGYLFFMITRLRRLLKINPDHDPLLFFLGTGAISGLAAIGFHSLFDFNLQIPANFIYFVVLMALVDNTVTQSRRRRLKVKRIRSRGYKKSSVF